MIVSIVLFMCIAAVLIFRPLTRKAGTVIEAAARNSLQRPTADREELTLLLQRLNARLELMEDRLDFVEKLNDRRSRRPALRSVGE
jgi:hypothetical protein